MLNCIQYEDVHNRIYFRRVLGRKRCDQINSGLVFYVYLTWIDIGIFTVFILRGSHGLCLNTIVVGTFQRQISDFV